MSRSRFSPFSWPHSIWWFAPLCLVVGGFLLVKGMHYTHLARESPHWPIAQGIIQKSESEYRHEYHGRAGSRGKYFAELLYEFRVSGKTYSGSRVAFGETNSGNVFHVEKILAKYPKGKSIKVAYLPGDPQVCVLEPGQRAFLWLVPGIGAILIVLSVGLVIPRSQKSRARGGCRTK